MPPIAENRFSSPGPTGEPSLGEEGPRAHHEPLEPLERGGGAEVHADGCHSCIRPPQRSWTAHALAAALAASLALNAALLAERGSLSVAGTALPWSPATSWGLEEAQARRLNAAPSPPAESSAASTPSAAENATAAEHETAEHETAEHEEHESHSHPHEALVFLFIAIIIGTAVLQMSMLPAFHGIQHTVALFVLGVAYTLIQHAAGLDDEVGMVWESYRMWMGIDPHLLLFTMLPVLLTGDSMSIDTAVARKVASQCLYLAGPGVLLCCGLTGVFLMYYLKWSFLLSMVAGSIWSATDPVAVVGLLKQLGAAPSLTVQIAGESLLNDGTAIVLFSITYDMLQGTVYGLSEILIFLCRTAVGACGVGWLIGQIFVIWIQSAENRFDHQCSTIQIALTVTCAYVSFIVAEALAMSGVLCTVVAGLVLADQMWPSIVEQESMHHVWHMFEYLGNTVIFFLAGALTGTAMITIPWEDYLHLLVLYLVLTFIRGFLLFASRPILTWLSADKQEVTRAEALIMTWGGLRGAVGLALAIQVRVNRANGFVSEHEAKRVLFFTGGIALLTLVINATTCPMLVKYLRVTEPDRTKRAMLLSLHKQLLAKAYKKECAPPCLELMNEMLSHVQTLLEKHAEEDDEDAELQCLDVNPATDGLPLPSEAPELSSSERQEPGSEGMPPTTSLTDRDRERSTPSQLLPTNSVDAGKPVGANLTAGARGSMGGVRGSMGGARSSMAGTRSSRRSNFDVANNRLREFLAMKLGSTGMTDAEALVRTFDLARTTFQELDVSCLELLTTIPTLPPAEDQDKMKEIIMQPGKFDPYMMKSVRGAFLSLVRAAYWEQIEHGEFAEGSSHAHALLNSVSFAYSHQTHQLTDFTLVLKELDLLDTEHRRGTNLSSRTAGVTQSMRSLIGASSDPKDMGMFQITMMQIINSTKFSIGLTICILLNIVLIFVEQGVRAPDSYSNTAWTVLEMIFNVAFTLEFVLKLLALRAGYFMQGSNLFDFSLLVLGWVSIVIELFAVGDEVLGSESGMLRMNRIFRAMRVLRVFRLVKFLNIIKVRLIDGNDVDQTVAQDFRAITLLMSFARAHLHAQHELTTFFGSGHMPATREQACCIMESQSYVYKAIAMATNQASHIDKGVLGGLNILRDATQVVQDLSHFVVKGHNLGVLNAKEADALLQPLTAHQRVWHKYIKRFEMGVTDGKPRTGVATISATLRRMRTRNSLRGAIDIEELTDQQLAKMSWCTKSLGLDSCAGSAEDGEATSRSKREEASKTFTQCSTSEFAGVVPVTTAGSLGVVDIDDDPALPGAPSG